jgi:hypothetical protein
MFDLIGHHRGIGRPVHLRFLIFDFRRWPRRCGKIHHGHLAMGAYRQMALPSQGPLPLQAGLPSNAFNCPPFKRMSVYPSGSRRIKAKNRSRRNEPKTLKTLRKSAKNRPKKYVKTHANFAQESSLPNRPVSLGWMVAPWPRAALRKEWQRHLPRLENTAREVAAPRAYQVTRDGSRVRSPHRQRRRRPGDPALEHKTGQAGTPYPAVARPPLQKKAAQQHRPTAFFFNSPRPTPYTRALLSTPCRVEAGSCGRRWVNPARSLAALLSALCRAL